MIWLLGLIVWFLEGALIGWIASRIMGNYMSLTMYFVVGIVGSLIGGIVAGLLGISGGFFVSMLVAVAGSCILLWIVGKIKRA